MSLWHKPIREITFTDIDAFCQLKVPESARLDYKGTAFPKELEKTISAFANTLGGLIILGVDADKATNTPIWPNSNGMPLHNGHQERVLQIASESITPAAPIEVSDVIENPNLKGTAIIVIRVIQSRLAPHATDKNRRVYVHSRDGSRNDPFELADIERIDYMLRQRRQLIDARESDLAASMERAKRLLRKSQCPIRWLSIAPVFPWRSLVSREACTEFLKWDHVTIFVCEGLHWSVQNTVSGAFAIGQMNDKGAMVNVAVVSIQANGALFAFGYAMESSHYNKTLLTSSEDLPNGGRWMQVGGFERLGKGMLEAAARFYSKCTHTPGEVLFSIGAANVRGAFVKEAHVGTASRMEFIDDEFRLDCVIRHPESSEEQQAVSNSIRDEVMFSFNVPSRL